MSGFKFIPVFRKAFRLGLGFRLLLAAQFIVTQVAWSAPKHQAPKLAKQKLIELIKKTQLSRKSQSFEEIYFALYDSVPKSHRPAWNYFVIETASLKLPKARVVQTDDQITLFFERKGVSPVLQFRFFEPKNPGDLPYSVSLNGYELPLENQSPKWGLKMMKALMSQQRGIASGSVKKRKNKYTLTPKELRRLSPQKFSQYISRLQLVLKQMEKLQDLKEKERVLKLKRTRKYSFFRWVDLITGKAYAASALGGSCVVAGFEGGYPEPPPKKYQTCKSDSLKSEACGSSNYTCNPNIFGMSDAGKPFCFSRKRISTATKTCQSKVMASFGGKFDNYKSWAQKHPLRGEGDGLEEFTLSLDKKISSTKQVCQAVADNPKKHGNLRKDQLLTCQALEAYRDSLAGFIAENVPPAPEVPPIAKKQPCGEGSKDPECLCQGEEKPVAKEETGLYICPVPAPVVKAPPEAIDDDCLRQNGCPKDTPSERREKKSSSGGFWASLSKGFSQYWPLLIAAGAGMFLGAMLFPRTKTKTKFVLPPMGPNKGGEATVPTSPGTRPTTFEGVR